MTSLGAGNLIRRTHTLCRSFVAHKPRVASSPLLSTAAPNLNLPTAFSRMSSSQAKRLAGKTVLITGASSGIGKSTALEFARTQPDDLKLILTARREDALKEVKQEIEGFAKGVKVHVVKLDVSNVEEIGKFVGNLPQEFKQIDVLVNNAYASSTPAFQDMQELTLTQRPCQRRRQSPRNQERRHQHHVSNERHRPDRNDPNHPPHLPRPPRRRPRRHHKYRLHRWPRAIPGWLDLLRHESRGALLHRRAAQGTHRLTSQGYRD